MRLRQLASVVLACLTLAACDGLREAFTAHVDVAAKAGSQELSVQRLAELLGKSKLGIPVTKQNAQTIATLWADYQLVAVAAARGDSITDAKAIDEAAAGFLAGLRLQRFTDSIGKTFTVDSATEAGYLSGKGNLYAARHILFGTNPTMSPTQKDSVRRQAQTIRAQVTDANFGDLAVKHSTEPAAKQSKGDLGVFQRQGMVKPFADAVAALKPGEISGLVETEFGFHIVQRLPYAAAREQYIANYGGAARSVAESTYLAGLETKAKVEVKDDAAPKLKNALKDISAHRKDGEELATYDGGRLTVGRFITWVNSAPNAGQVAQQLQSFPDSQAKAVIGRVVRNELMLKEADRMKIDIPAGQRDTIHQQFRQLIRQIWDQLGLSPKSLADSAKSQSERERLAASRVDAYLDRVVNGQAQPVTVPPILSSLLADKYDMEINAAALDKALEQAQKLRVASDSTRASQQPPSSVPLPGAVPQNQSPQSPPAGGAGQQPPAGQPGRP